MSLYDNNDHSPPHRHDKGRGIGTIIACFAIAFVVVSLFDSNEHRQVKRVVAKEAHEMLMAANDVTERTPPDSDDVVTYKINKGHVVIVPTSGEAAIDMKDDMRARAQIKVNGKRTTITIDDDYSDDSKIKISVPANDACRIELSAGLLEVKRLPCSNSELIVRSGKMEVTDVPQAHGVLTGSVSVGTVKIDGGSGKVSKSSGVGDLRAEAPATGKGPALVARVDVGMLTVDVE
jgi:hypothetical protein